MASHLAEMWDNGLLLFYGSIALVIALDVAVKLSGDGKRRKAPEPHAPAIPHGHLGAMVESTP
jgi:hypothetical protein